VKVDVQVGGRAEVLGPHGGAAVAFVGLDVAWHTLNREAAAAHA